jgi:hypothetical protein
VDVKVAYLSCECDSNGANAIFKKLVLSIRDIINLNVYVM